MMGEGNAFRQHAVLAAIEGTACVPLDELVAVTTLTHRQVSAAVCGLITRGYVSRIEAGCYLLTEEGAAAKAAGVPLSSGRRSKLTQAKPRQPRRRTLRQRVWKAIRFAHQSGDKFTIPDLVAAAATGAEKDAKTNVMRYVRTLEQAGIVARLRQRIKGTALTSPGHVRYFLVRDLGPEAPVYRPARGELFDQNSGEAIQCPNG